MSNREIASVVESDYGPVDSPPRPNAHLLNSHPTPQLTFHQRHLQLTWLWQLTLWKLNLSQPVVVWGDAGDLSLWLSMRSISIVIQDNNGLPIVITDNEDNGLTHRHSRQPVIDAKSIQRSKVASGATRLAP